MPLPLTVLPHRAPNPPLGCLECGHCCTYVAVGINAPTRLRYATDILWYLYHEKVSVHLDLDGEWSVIFETRCRNLQDDLKCAIYEQRPEICREFDNTGCEVNAPDERARVFTLAAHFLEFLAGWRPKVHAQVLARFVPPPARP